VYIICPPRAETRERERERERERQRERQRQRASGGSCTSEVRSHSTMCIEKHKNNSLFYRKTEEKKHLGTSCSPLSLRHRKKKREKRLFCLEKKHLGTSCSPLSLRHRKKNCFSIEKIGEKTVFLYCFSIEKIILIRHVLLLPSLAKI